jgi:hypothetical protein
MIALALFSIVYGMWKKKKGARNILDNQKKVYGQVHEFKEVYPHEFPWLDMEYYNRTQVELERLGFKHQGDIEDVTISSTYPSMRTFLRVMYSDNGAVQAAIYDIKMRSFFMKFLQLITLLPKDMKTVDMETEFSNGLFICTTNAGKQASFIKSPPQIVSYYLPKTYSVDELLRYHYIYVSTYLAQNPEVKAIQCPTLLSSIDSQNRMQVLKNIYRESQGWISREELLRIGGDSMGETAMDTYNEIEKLKEKDEHSRERWM